MAATGDLFQDGDASYSSRPRPETPREVVANRIGVTATLFTAVMGLSVLLGRRRA